MPTPKPTHGGKRIRAGRKPALLPLHLKKFRATEEEWIEFNKYMTGKARNDFCAIMYALKFATMPKRYE